MTAGYCSGLVQIVTYLWFLAELEKSTTTTLRDHVGFILVRRMGVSCIYGMQKSSVFKNDAVARIEAVIAAVFDQISVIL